MQTFTVEEDSGGKEAEHQVTDIGENQRSMVPTKPREECFKKIG